MSIETENWVIVHCGVENFIGRASKEDDNIIMLDPAFNWNAGIQQMPNGSLAFIRQILPFQSSMALSCIEINKKACVGIERIDGWPERDKMEIFNNIEQRIEAMQAASAGIVQPQKGRIQL
jgi:hypothetical protein